MHYATTSGTGSRIFFPAGKAMSEARRQIIDCSWKAVLYRNRAGIPWRDLPERFGDWKIVHQRFSRWAKSGVFERHVPGEITMITAPVAGLLTGAALDWRGRPCR